MSCRTTYHLRSWEKRKYYKKFKSLLQKYKIELQKVSYKIELQ